MITSKSSVETVQSLLPYSVEGRNRIPSRLTAVMTTLTFVGTLGVCPEARADLLTYFNFNEQTTGAPTLATLTADAPGIQLTPTIDISNSGAGVTTFAGTTVNQAGGDATGATGALAFVGGTSNVNNGKYFQFTFSTVGFDEIVLSYATQRTGTGFTSQALSYSTDGTNFTNFGANTAIPLTFASPPVVFDLSSVLGINDKPSVTFRLTLTGATNAGGNNRFDNIQVNSVPEPATVFGAIALLGLVGYRERRRIAGWLPQSAEIF